MARVSCNIWNKDRLAFQIGIGADTPSFAWSRVDQLAGGLAAEWPEEKMVVARIRYATAL